MRELTLNEVEDVSGGILPLIAAFYLGYVHGTMIYQTYYP